MLGGAGWLLSVTTEPVSDAPALDVGHPLKPTQVSELILSESSAKAEQPVKALPSSFAGLSEPSSLDVAPDGSLIINSKVIELFDFYLAALGEESIEDVVIRVQQHLVNSLGSIAHDQALQIFEDYLQYLNQVTLLKQRYQLADSSLEAIVMAKDDINDIRAQYFTASMITAFWGRSDQYEQYMMSVVMINKDQRLSPSQRRDSIEQLNQLAPSWLIAQRLKSNRLNDYRAQLKTLSDDGADAVELSNFTYAQFDDAAAQRLIALQAQRSAWQQRLVDYRQELDQLLESSVSDQAQQQQITQLRNRYFDSQQLKRVDSLDRQYLKKKAKKTGLKSPANKE